MQVILMGMRFSGNRIWKVQVNFRAEVKLTGKRGKKCTDLRKKKRDGEKEAEDEKVKGKEMVS